MKEFTVIRGAIRSRDKNDYIKILKGDKSLIMDALHWRKTPQGSTAWNEAYTGDRLLSLDQKVFLLFCYYAPWDICNRSIRVTFSEAALARICASIID